ncbi:MAG: Hint domain-containing protein [Rhodobacteraceae bacterium]|nr:Hint domain-containing protein [Paracoccaceae bacterium]
MTSIEVFRAGEGLAEADRIDFTALGGLRSGQIGLSEADREAAGGTYTPEGGPAIAFGPSAAVTLADILADPATYGEGRVEITDGAESGTLDGVAFENFETIEFGIIRFAADVAIAVPGGTVPAGRLAVGDLVLTADRGAQPIRWIGRRVLGPAELAARPNLRPIRICAGALGGGLPRRAMLVSPQHRMLIATGRKAGLRGGRGAGAGQGAAGLPGVAVAEDLDGIRYVHFLCDRHEVVFAEGAPSESLLPGPQALRSLAPAPRAELLALFPLLARSGPACRPARWLTAAAVPGLPRNCRLARAPCCRQRPQTEARPETSGHWS